MRRSEVYAFTKSVCLSLVCSWEASQILSSSYIFLDALDFLCDKFWPLDAFHVLLLLVVCIHKRMVEVNSW